MTAPSMPANPATAAVPANAASSGTTNASGVQAAAGAWRRLYRLLADGPAVPRLLALGLSGLVLQLAVAMLVDQHWAMTGQLDWPALLGWPALVGAAVLACLPRQLGMPWPVVLAGLSLLGLSSQLPGLVPVVMGSFVVMAGLLLPFWSTRLQPPLVGVAWAGGLALMLLAASQLAAWALAALLDERGARSLLTLGFSLLCAAPGWLVARLVAQHPLRLARRLMVLRTLLWRVGLGSALWALVASQVDPAARLAWRLLAGSRTEAWAGPLAWAGTGLLALAGLLVVWRVPVWLARAQLRGRIAARAATDACVIGGLGGAMLALLWVAITWLDAPLGASRLGQMWDAPLASSQGLHLFAAALLALAVHVGLRLALGAPLQGMGRRLWICLPPDGSDEHASLPDETLHRAAVLAAGWQLGPVTLIAPRHAAAAFSGAHGVLAQEAGVADGLFTPPQAGDSWQREGPTGSHWTALPVREHHLAARPAAAWAEVAGWVPADADVCVITAAASSTAGQAVHQLCAALPPARSEVWQSSPPPAATPPMGQTPPRRMLPFAGLRCSHVAARQRVAVRLWVASRVVLGRGAARERRRFLLLHADQDAAFAALLMQALLGRRDHRGLRVQAAALAYDGSAQGPALAAARSAAFSRMLLGDGALWSLLMADAVGLARRDAFTQLFGDANHPQPATGLLPRLAAQLAWWSTSRLAQARPLDVLVLESGLPDAAQRAGLPRRSGAGRLVSLWPCELADDAPPFHEPGAGQVRLRLPPRSAWTDRSAGTLADLLLDPQARLPDADATSATVAPAPPPPAPAAPQSEPAAEDSPDRVALRLCIAHHPAPPLAWEALTRSINQLWELVVQQAQQADALPLRIVGFTPGEDGPLSALDAAGAVLVVHTDGADTDGLLQTLRLLNDHPALRSDDPPPRLLVWRGHLNPNLEPALLALGWEPLVQHGADAAVARTPTDADQRLMRGLAAALARQRRLNLAPDAPA